MTSSVSLSKEDVKLLLAEPSSENRAAAAEKVAASFSSDGLSAEERKLAEDIFRLLVKDAAIRVRKALSDSLNDNPAIPRDVALALAQDIEEVAIPMIEKSTVLTDDDLVELVTSSEVSAVHVAIAGREIVSGRVSEAIAEQGSEEAVSTLIENKGADMTEVAFDKVLRKYADHDSIKGSLSLREDLPLGIAERLVSLVSEKVQDHLSEKFNISGFSAEEMMQESRERATVSLLAKGSPTKTVLELVDQIHDKGRLTPTLLIRALCMGDVTFFEAGLAQLVNIPVSNAYKLVRDKSGLGLKRLFEAAAMPADFLPLAQAALEVVDETVVTTGDDRTNFRNVMIERVLTRVEDNLDAENLDYLINRMSARASA